MDHSRELARLLQRAEKLRLDVTRPPVWVGYRYSDEPVPAPPSGQDTFKTHIIITVDGSRPDNDPNRAYGFTCPQI